MMSGRGHGVNDAPTDGMTNGCGYLALAAIIVGRWSLAGALVACLLFGVTDRFQPRRSAPT